MGRNTDGSFYQRLQESAAEHGWPVTQRGLARKLGVAPRAVQKWAEGGGPSMKRATEIAASLRVNVNWLLTGQGSKRDLPIDRDLQELVEIWRALSASERQQLLDTARFFRQRAETGKHKFLVHDTRKRYDETPNTGK